MIWSHGAEGGVVPARQPVPNQSQGGRVLGEGPAEERGGERQGKDDPGGAPLGRETDFGAMRQA